MYRTQADRTYCSWARMRSRCNNPNNPGYGDYGGRGISCCERWDNFWLFLEDMGERPPGTSIDRIDFNGNYEKSNCRWAIPAIQAINKRLRKDSSSGLKGVHRHRRSGMWAAQFKHRHIGLFSSAEEASLAHDNEESKYMETIK